MLLVVPPAISLVLFTQDIRRDSVTIDDLGEL